MKKFQHIRLFIERYQDRLMIGLYFVFLLWVGSSCSCNYHLKQAAKKCPSLVVQDTILVHDSILVDKITTDTIFKSGVGDTVYINKDRLHIKYVRLLGETNYVQAECDTVFVSRFIKVPYQKTVINHKPSRWQIFIEVLGQCFFWILIILIILGIIWVWKFIH